MQQPHSWRKASRSQNTASCVEVANTLTHLRDSKNGQGAALRLDVAALVSAIKADRLNA